MKTAKVEIKGNAPYYFSKPTDDKTPKTAAQETKVAKNKVYANGAGLHIPSRQLRGAMIGAVGMAKMKIERSSKRAQDLLKTRLISIEPEEIPFIPKMNMDDISIVKHWTVLDMGKGRFNMYARISRPEWKLKFKIHIGDIFEPEFVEEALKNAGLLCGIGGRRPYNGTFEVMSFKV